MEQIYPMTEQHINHYQGMMVCAVLKSGYRQIGVLEGCRTNKLFIRNDHALSNGQSVSIRSTPSLQTMHTKQSKSKKASRKKTTNNRAEMDTSSSTNYAQPSDNPASKTINNPSNSAPFIALSEVQFLMLMV